MNLINSVIQKLSGAKTWFWKTSLRNKLIIIVVIIAALWFGVPRIINTNQKQPQYQTAQAEKGTLITKVSASGTVSQGSSASITTQATGIVKEVYVADGDTVTAGQNIAAITLDVSSHLKQAAAWASYLSA
ncbi:MAG: biotin/lipoyl-binding protein, partial [Candidatus Wolfebacteria bacterium]|nr:biotin/lipoyl-binding protein [Candidatus Wolfebacteria bacterium]